MAWFQIDYTPLHKPKTQNLEDSIKWIMDKFHLSKNTMLEMKTGAYSND